MRILYDSHNVLTPEDRIAVANTVEGQNGGTRFVCHS